MVTVKVNELSRISGVSTETIRMYRNMGLINPKQLANGYFDYTDADLRNLLHIRKMRGAGMGIENIKYLNLNSNQSEAYDTLREECESLEAQLKELKNQLYMLKVTMEHFRLYRDNPDDIVEINVAYDSYSVFYGKGITPTAIEWMGYMNYMTQSIRISPEIMLAHNLPDTIELDFGVGTYDAVLYENNIAIPPNATCIPKGKYLTCWLIPETDNTIKKEKLVPLLKYAYEHNYRLTGDTTAFLYRVDISDDEPRFIYRFRARYE